MIVLWQVPSGSKAAAAFGWIVKGMAPTIRQFLKPRIPSGVLHRKLKANFVDSDS